MRDIKSIIKSFRSEDLLTAISSLNLPETRLLIDKADSTYHRVGLESPLTDEEYDAIKNHLRTIDPEDERLSRVGVPYSAEELRNKVEHTIPMGSLDNTDDGIAGYDTWYDWILQKLGVSEAPVFASLKIDGGSVRARYEEGKLKVVATRGNGEVGEDITANGINFHNLPLELPEPITCDVRGEAILYIKDFQKLVEAERGVPFDQIPKKEISNPRNVGNGILGRDNGQDSEKIHLLAFNIITEGRDYESEEAKMEHMKELGFQPVPYRVCADRVELQKFYNTTASGRDSLPMEIDGVAVVVNDVQQQERFVTDDISTRLRPKHSRAIKFPHRAATTTLKDVDITLGHTGAVIPTAILEEVRIGGVNVTHALLNNWEEINRLGVAIGDKVEVILAGDIIPKVIRCVKKGSNRQPITEPTVCPSCGSPTTRELRGKNGAVTYCTDPVECPEALLGKIDHWIGGSKKGVGILGIGDTILKALWDQKILTDPSDLYTLAADDLKDVELEGGGRIGKARAATIVENIQAKKNLPLHIFLGSLGIELLGRRRVQILQKAAKGKLDSLDDWLDTEQFRKLEVEGLGKTIRESIVSGIEANRALIQRFLDKGVTVGQPKPSAEQSEHQEGNTQIFDGLSFCLTGTRECQDDIERLGGTLKSGVSKKLDFLVQKDPLSRSNKTQKAEDYGVRVISIEYLKSVIAGKSSLSQDDTQIPVPSESPRVSDDAAVDSLVDDLI